MSSNLLKILTVLAVQGEVLSIHSQKNDQLQNHIDMMNENIKMNPLSGENEVIKEDIEELQADTPSFIEQVSDAIPNPFNK